MTHPNAPTLAFNAVDLKIRRIPAAKIFGRINRTPYPPLSFGLNSTRFSDPQAINPSKKFGVLYLGTSLEVCFLEAVLRDLRNGKVADVPMSMNDFTSRNYVNVATDQPLRLIDLTGDKKVVMGIPSDVTNASDQTLGRLWSEAIYFHPENVDGILYQSRLCKQNNLAIFDRAVPKLQVAMDVPLLRAMELPRLISKYKVAIGPGI